MARPTEFPTWAARMSTRAHCGCLAQAYAVLRSMFPELKANETTPTRSHLRFQSYQPGDRRPPTAWLQLDDRAMFNVEETSSGRHLFCPNRNRPTSSTNRRAPPRTAGGCPRKPRSSRPTRTSATATTTPSSSAATAPHHLPATPGPTVSATGGDAVPQDRARKVEDCEQRAVPAVPVVQHAGPDTLAQLLPTDHLHSSTSPLRYCCQLRAAGEPAPFTGVELRVAAA